MTSAVSNVAQAVQGIINSKVAKRAAKGIQSLAPEEQYLCIDQLL